MAKLLCNIILNLRQSISHESSRRAFASVTRGYRPLAVHSLQCSNFNRSDRRNGKIKGEHLLCAVPIFLAYFKKPEGEDSDATWLEKLIPLNIRLIFQKEDDSPEGRLVMTMKRAIICIQREQYEKGEQIIHLALRMAQEMQHADAITLCYDIMANLALETEQHEKAEKLFVGVMKRLLQKGVEQNDIKILHISLKIAQIAESLLQQEKATQGYEWTIQQLEKEVEAHKNDADLYELLGLANDYYGKFLLTKGDYVGARARLTTSYNVYTQIHGKENENVVDMLNNLGVVCTYLDDLTAAEVYLNEAIQMARKYPEMFQTGIYHANLGLLYLRKSLLPQAQSSCSLARRMAKESDSPEGTKQANYCIDQIKAQMG